jgi:hypothetical protein
VKVSNGRAVESSTAKFCGRDRYSLFSTCFEDMPAYHASLNCMQKVQTQASEEFLDMLSIPYPKTQP